MSVHDDNRSGGDNLNLDDGFFEFGDIVRSIQNPHLTGVVIGERSWGDEYQVRLADGASTIWWFAIEIEHVAPPECEGNVVDFTKERALRVKTTTEGAA